MAGGDIRNDLVVITDDELGIVDGTSDVCCCDDFARSCRRSSLSTGSGLTLSVSMEAVLSTNRCDTAKSSVVDFRPSSNVSVLK